MEKKMENGRNKREKVLAGLKERRYALLAAVLTAFTAVVLFSLSGRLIGGSYVFVRGDLMSQFAPTVRQFLNSLFGPEDIDYSFYVGMGMPMTSVYAGCLSPFNLLFWLIDDINLAAFAVAVSKLAFVAYIFQGFSRRVLKNNTLSSVAFSVAYALCSYTIAYYQNLMFFDALYMTPIIVELVILFVKEGKWRALTIAYAYFFLVNYYMAYMVGFFSLIFLIALMVSEYKKSWKRYAVTGLRFTGIVIWAALMGVVFLAPAAYALLGDRTPDATPFRQLQLTLPDLYGNLFLGQMQTQEGIFPMIYCGVAVVYLLPLYFMDKAVGKKEKIICTVLFGFLFLCSFWLPGYIFIHCFDAPDYYGYRFSFLYSFLLAAICCRQWNRIEEAGRKKLTVLALINVIAYYLIYLLQKNTLRLSSQSMSILGWEINILFLFLLLVLMRYAKRGEESKKKAERFLVALMMVELVANGFFLVTRADYYRTDYKTVYHSWIEKTEGTIRAVRQEDDGFYRIRYQNALAQDQAILFNYMDIPYFSTIENWRLRDTLRLLGYSVSPRNVSDAGWTPVTEMLFAQRYIVMAHKPLELEEEPEVWPFYKNETALEIGFMVGEGLREVALQENALENLNLVLQGMTGEDIVCMIPYTGDVQMQFENILLEETGEGYYNLYRENPEVAEARLSYRIDANPLYRSYSYFSQTNSIMDICAPVLYGESGTYLTAPAILPTESGEDKDSMFIETDGMTLSQSYYRNHYFAYYDPAALQKAYEALKDHQFIVTERSGSHIRGTVEVAEDKTILFTSIPYDQGWKIYVDGVEAETEALLNETFLCTELTPGTHEIEMVYQSRLDVISVWISVAACVAFLLVACPLYKRRDGENETEKTKNEQIKK